MGPVHLKKEAKAWTEFQCGEDKGYDVILVEKGKGFMRLKLCELGCSVFDEKAMEMYAGPALQMQVEGGRGSKKLWCACYLNPKNFPENLVFVVAGLPKLCKGIW